MRYVGNWNKGERSASFHVWQERGNWFRNTSRSSSFPSSFPPHLHLPLHPPIRPREIVRGMDSAIRGPCQQFTLAPTDPATSSSLVLNSRGLQLHILCWSLRASRHLAAPSIASIWHSRSPVAAAVPIALSYCRKAFCNMSIFISTMLSAWHADRHLRCVN